MEYQVLDRRLKALGMDWNHHRVTAFLNDCRTRYGYNFPANQMPTKVADRLSLFLAAYEETDRLMKLDGLNWTDELVTSFFMQHSRNANGNFTNRLTLDKWRELWTLFGSYEISF